MKSPTVLVREQLTPRLRWSNEVLEQEWVVTSYGDEFCEKEATLEWRPVPRTKET